MILTKISRTDIIICLVIALICGILYLGSGLILLKKKDQSLISKKYRFRNPEDFCKLYAILEIIFSSVLLVVSILGMIFTSQYVMFISIAFVLVATLLIVQVTLQKKFRVPLGGGKKPVKPLKKVEEVKKDEEK